MSAERIVERVGKMGRRSFLIKLGGTAFVGGVASLLGTGSAEAAAGTIPYRCCNVCLNPTTCNGTQYACSWCWQCNTSPTCKYSCCEYYSSTGSGCTGGCNGVACSRVTRVACN